jgi:hypothetical protein
LFLLVVGYALGMSNYYQAIGSDDGLVKVHGRWIRIRGLNRIHKSGWVRWQGPMTSAMEKGKDVVDAIDFFEGRI